MARKKKPDRLDEMLAELVKGKSPDEILGETGILKELTKRLVESALEGEMTDHLGYEPRASEGRNSGTSRNGKTGKTIRTDTGDVEIDVPRDRDASFDPQLVRKRQKRLEGFDDKVIALYGRRMTTREIQGHLKEMYGTEVSPALISNVTDSVLDDVRAWQSRPLDAIYPILYLDALHVKMRLDGMVQTRAVYLALGVNLDGHKELLGLWIGEKEGSKFWLSILAELKSRGVRDILIACVDGLTGFPDAIESEYPKAQVQLCIVHMVRNSLRFVSWKERKIVARDLRAIYTASTADAARAELEAFAEKYDARPDDRQVLAGPVGSGDAVLRVPAGDPQGDLHHQRDRVDAVPAAASDAAAGRVPDAGVGDEGAVPVDPPDLEAVEPADQGLGRRPEPLQHRVRGKDPVVEERSLTQKAGHPPSHEQLVPTPLATDLAPARWLESFCSPKQAGDPAPLRRPHRPQQPEHVRSRQIGRQPNLHAVLLQRRVRDVSVSPDPRRRNLLRRLRVSGNRLRLPALHERQEALARPLHP